MNKTDKKRYEEIMAACQEAYDSGINIVKQHIGFAGGGYINHYRKTAHPLYALLIAGEGHLPPRRPRWRFSFNRSDYKTFNKIFKELKKKKRIPLSWMVGFDCGLNYASYGAQNIDFKLMIKRTTYHVYKSHYGISKKEMMSWIQNGKGLKSFERGFVVGLKVKNALKNPTLKTNRARKHLRSAVKSAIKAKLSGDDIKSIINECLVEDVLNS